MFHTVLSAALDGLESRLISVEADISDGMPLFSMVGYLASEVKEARDRVRTALRNSGVRIPAKRITVNLAPGNMRKSGAGFDLPIAVALLMAMEHIPPGEHAGGMVVGELSLNGKVHAVAGILPMVMSAAQAGCPFCLVPKENEKEASVVKGIQVIGVESIFQVIQYFREPERFPPVYTPTEELLLPEDRLYTSYEEDFSQVRGQEGARRAAEIAAAGFHNLLLSGPPGAGKTMIAERMVTILPPLNIEESLEVSKIHSIAGILPEGTPLMQKRPCNSPHYTVTSAALIGGGTVAKPGICSLSHKGILIIHEALEMKRDTLETLRQPLEEGRIAINRGQKNYIFPADFMLVLTMNPCPCGEYPDRSRCLCTPGQIRKYNSRLSGPMLDRIDLCVDVSKIKYEEMAGVKKEESSAEIRKRVFRAHERQEKRYRGTKYTSNRDLDVQGMHRYCRLGKKEKQLMKDVFGLMDLSARGYHRVLKVARTIADLAGAERIESAHISEAVCYRIMDKGEWL